MHFRRGVGDGCSKYHAQSKISNKLILKLHHDIFSSYKSVTKGIWVDLDIILVLSLIIWTS